jgi:serine/threonine protein kinase
MKSSRFNRKSQKNLKRFKGVRKTKKMFKSLKSLKGGRNYRKSINKLKGGMLWKNKTKKKEKVDIYTCIRKCDLSTDDIKKYLIKLKTSDNNGQVKSICDEVCDNYIQITKARELFKAAVVDRDIKRKEVKLIKRIGGGQYGDVFKGILSNDFSFSDGNFNIPSYIVACKAVKGQHKDNYTIEIDNRETIDQTDLRTEEEKLLREATITKEIGTHPNIASFIGLFSVSPVLLIIQYCEHGSLKVQLDERKKQRGTLLSTYNKAIKLMQSLKYLGDRNKVYVKTDGMICEDIATGMNYLKTKKIVHCDLAARNILLDSNFTAKVCDFGWSKEYTHDTPYYKQDKTICRGVVCGPVRWMAPELQNKRGQDLFFSEQTDVWSFGCVMLEIVTNGDMPYSYLKQDAPQILLDWSKISKNISEKQVVPQGYPDVRPTKTARLNTIMDKCWLTNGDRPTFIQLISLFQANHQTDKDEIMKADNPNNPASPRKENRNKSNYYVAEPIPSYNDNDGYVYADSIGSGGYLVPGAPANYSIASPSPSPSNAETHEYEEINDNTGSDENPYAEIADQENDDGYAKYTNKPTNNPYGPNPDLQTPSSQKL